MTRELDRETVEALNMARLATLGGAQYAKHHCQNLEGDFSSILMHIESALASTEHAGRLSEHQTTGADATSASLPAPNAAPQESSILDVINRESAQAGDHVKSSITEPAGAAPLSTEGVESFHDRIKKLPSDEGEEDYVGWCYYPPNSEPTAIELCGSDTPGAFKVYRHPVPLPADSKLAEAVPYPQVCRPAISQGELIDWARAWGHLNEYADQLERELRSKAKGGS